MQKRKIIAVCKTASHFGEKKVWHLQHEIFRQDKQREGKEQKRVKIPPQQVEDAIE